MVLTSTVRFRAKVTVPLLFETLFCQTSAYNNIELLSRVV
jgi:hypothetical protein